MEPLYEHRLTLAGFETRALELEGAGPPLVLLHGYADSADSWRRTLDLLARKRRRAIALDLPGFGTAGPLDPGHPVLDQLDEFVAAAVHQTAEQHGEVVLVGNSLGGCLSLRAAENAGLPLRGVVPVAPAGFDHPRWFRAIEAQPLIRAVLAAPFPVPEPIVRGMVGQVYRALAFADQSAITGEVVASFTAHHRSREALSSYLATGRRMLAELQDPFNLHDIRVPVLLVWGDRDRMVTHKGSRWLIEALPDTEYELLEGVGHCPQVEAPQRFVEVVERFAA